MRRVLLALLVCLPSAAQNSISTFFAQTFEERLRDEPEFATGIGRHEYDDRWNDWSKSGRDRLRAHRAERLRQLSAFSLASLNPQDRLSARLMEYILREQIESTELVDGLLSVTQQGGLHNRVYNIFDRMPARTPRDYQNLLARLNAIPTYIDQNIAMLDESVARGITQPKVVVDLVNAQLTAPVAQDEAHTALLAAFRKFPPSIPTRPSCVQRRATPSNTAFSRPGANTTAISPEHTRHGRANLGLGSIADGAKDYNILVRLYTTTNRTPEEIHKLGLGEVNRIEGEMRAVLREAGFSGTIPAYEQHLESSPNSISITKKRCWFIAATLPRSWNRGYPICSNACRACCMGSGRFRQIAKRPRPPMPRRPRPTTALPDG